MPYIGKPQSADPITVNTSNIDDGTIQAVDISSSFREHISGSFQGGGSNKISGSLTSTGSFGKVEVGSGKITTTGNMVLDADGAQIRLEDGGTEFGRISRVSSDLVIKSISNNNDILFKGVDGSATITALQLDMSEAGNAIFNNDVTIAGTLTAQEIHTEFTSASILFTSGSTIFGNSSDDVHNMTGSLNISGSLFVKDGTLTVTDNVDFNGDLDVDGTTNLDVVDIDGAVDMASTLKAGDTILGQTGNQKGKLTIQSRTGAATRKTNAIVAVPYNDTSESICMIGMDGQSSNNEMHIGSNTSDFMSPTFIDFFTASDVNSQTNNRVMRITSAGDVGIGTDSPDGKLHIHDGSAGSVTANGDAANLVIESSATGADTGLSILSKNTRANQIFFGDEDDNDVGAIGYVHNGNYMFFRTNTSEQVRIDSSGNVGIANTLGESTLSDYTHLFIGGTGTVISNATEADGNQMYVGNNVYIDSTTGAFQRQRNDEATLYKSINGTHLFQVAGTGTPDADITFTDALIIDNSGKVGIGTNSPLGKLHIHNPAGGVDEDTLIVSSSFRHYTAQFDNAASNYDSALIGANTPGRSGSTVFKFFRAADNSEEKTNIIGDGSIQARNTTLQAFDYAEFFEVALTEHTASGIPAGVTVALTGSKVIPASQSNEEPIGIVRPRNAPAIIGNSPWNHWHAKYKTTDYGEPILDENQNPIVNPSFVSQSYTPREDRNEWVIVGLLGQIPITNGQPTGSSWRKMHNISPTASMWFVK
jgi:hypothetical protein